MRRSASATAVLAVLVYCLSPSQLLARLELDHCHTAVHPLPVCRMAAFSMCPAATALPLAVACCGIRTAPMPRLYSPLALLAAKKVVVSATMVTPVRIMHPSYYQQKRPRPRFQDVFRGWAVELTKPDFNLQHAAKAVRFLPKLNFSGFTAEDPFFVALMDRCTKLLCEGNVSGKDISDMLSASALLRHQLPQLQEKLLPQLLNLSLQELDQGDWRVLVRFTVAARELQDGAQDLWTQLPRHLRAIADKAQVIATEDFPKLGSALANMPLDIPEVQSTLEELQAEAFRRLVDLDLPGIVMMLSAFSSARGNLSPELLDKASNVVLEKIAMKPTTLVDPELAKMVHAYAVLDVRNAALLKGVARTAIRQGLAMMGAWSVAALSWSYNKLAAPGDGLADFRRLVGDEVRLRGLSHDEVACSRHGPDGNGNHTLHRFWESRGPREHQRPLFIAPRPIGVLRGPQ